MKSSMLQDLEASWVYSVTFGGNGSEEGNTDRFKGQSGRFMAQLKGAEMNGCKTKPLDLG